MLPAFGTNYLAFCHLFRFYHFPFVFIDCSFNDNANEEDMKKKVTGNKNEQPKVSRRRKVTNQDEHSSDDEQPKVSRRRKVTDKDELSSDEISSDEDGCHGENLRKNKRLGKNKRKSAERIKWSTEEINILKKEFKKIPSTREAENILAKYNVLSNRSVSKMKSQVQYLIKLNVIK